MTTTTRPPIRQAELLGALGFASDLAFGVEVEAGARSCLIAVRIAQRMGLSREDRAAVYYTALLKDAGCTAMTGTLAEFWKTDEITARRELILGDLRSPSFLARWMWQHVGAELPFASRVGRLATVVAQSRGFFAEGFSNTCEVATAIAARLGMSDTVQQALLNVFEEWDGKGFPKGLKGEEIPLVARVVLPSFYFGCLCGIGGLQAATTLARDGRGSLFDPAVVDAFLALTSEDGFRRELSEPGLPARVAVLEPQAAVEMDAAGLDTWFEVFADFGDLKVPRTAAHSRRVAALAEGMARRLGCGPEDTDDIRRAAFAHDIGLVSVPTYALQKAATDQSAIEREQFRLHPYTAGRVLSQAPGLARIVTLIQAHHERFDGTGFYQGLKGAQTPLGSRIIGVADVFDDLTQDGPDAPALDTDTALRRMREQRGTAHCPDSLDALEAELAGAAPAPARAQRPGGLTEREVEILRLAAHGATRGEIARELVVSEHTVRHHLSHIYEKLGVTTRVGATLWAMEHGLFSQTQR